MIFTIIFCCSPVAASSRLALGHHWPDTPRSIFFTCDFSSSEREAVRAAMQKWNAVNTPSGDSIVDMYLTTNSDERNSITYGYPFGSWIGKMDPVVDWYTNEVIYVTIELSGEENWSVGGSSTSYDIQTVAQHELGHALGVAHCHEKDEADPCWSPTCNSNVMYYRTDTGEVRRTLTSYDKSSYINIYW